MSTSGFKLPPNVSGWLAAEVTKNNTLLNQLAKNPRVDLKRFTLSGRAVLFKSRLAMPTEIANQRYNQWYKIATIPSDIFSDATPNGREMIVKEIACMFVALKHKPLTEDEVRSALFAGALSK